jgi:hypothetical protein
LENPNSDIFTTILDVDGAALHINPLGEVTEGDSFKIILADSVRGTLTIATEGWNFDPATGSVVFGAIGCNSDSMGDLDGNRKVEFADFLVLSGNFGTDVEGHEQVDIDCNGKVEFADFLILSGNFGTEVGGAESIPEPAGQALVGLAACFVGMLRIRRW